MSKLIIFLTVIFYGCDSIHPKYACRKDRLYDCGTRQTNICIMVDKACIDTNQGEENE